MKKDFVKTIAKAFVATALTLSYIPMNSVHAIETSNIKISAVSDVSWCGEIPGFGTYPQRALSSITLEYDEDVNGKNLKKEDFVIQDILYPNEKIEVEDIDVNGNKIVLDVDTHSAAGVLTAPGGNFRRYVSEFKVKQMVDIVATNGNILSSKDTEKTFNQDNIRNIASDEFKDLKLDSQTSDNKIYVKYYLPENYSKNKKYPMVVHCTGGGQQYRTNTPDERLYGKDNFGVELDIDLTPKTFSTNAPEDTIMVTIQCLGENQPNKYNPGKDIDQTVQYFIDHYAVDTNRVYAVGNSQGGVFMSSAVYQAPQLFTAYLPCNTSIVSGDKSSEDKEAYKTMVEYCQTYVDNDISIWFHRGENDFTGPYTEVTIPYDVLVKMYKDKGYSQLDINKKVKQTKYSDDDFKTVGSTYYHGATGLMCLNKDAIDWVYKQTKDDSVQLTASYDKAINEVIIPRYEKDGTKTNQKVSELLKAHLNTKDLMATKDSKEKALTVDIQLKDVYLNSEYLNGKSEAGMSYYNMLNFYTNVKQVKQLLDANPGYSVIDSQRNKLDKVYIDELLGLLDQINDMDPKTNLKYDMDSVYDSKVFNQETTRGGTDVIATSQEGNVSLKFHIDSHGWWGYDLGADDSITSLVMGFDQKAIDADRAERESPITKQYGNFFVIEMENAGKGKWYMLNGTDLENPIIYVSSDGKEAFMIDVDFYGENVINQVIKSVIGDKCESLKIFLTHNHGDHVNNLAQIAKDERLKEITTLVWPENEPHTKLNGVDLVELFDYTTIKDMQTIIVADNTFQFIEIPDEHTPGGGQLADLTNKVLYSGDTLGAQVHLGGGTVMMSKIDSWLNGALKSAKYIEENDIRYNIGGHTPYLNNPQFASWVAKAIQYGKEQLASDPAWKGGLVIVENGKIVDSTRMGEIFAKGLSDRDELNIASINFINDLDHKEDSDDNQVPDSNDNQTPNNNDNQTPNNNDKKPIVDNQQTTVVKTEDQSLLAGFALTALMAFVVGVVVYKKRKENE